MGALLAVMTPLRLVNEALLTLGRAIGVFAVAAMVVAILIQVFYRYVLNNALPWPDEAARFCMLWMTGLMAPTAFRRGGFVAIDTLIRLLPTRVGALISLLLLFVSLGVLVVAVEIGWSEVTGFAGKFATASLYVPTDFAFESWLRVPRSWMMASLLVGIVLLISVNIELILRALVRMMGGGDHLPAISLEEQVGAE
ncbi:TRAP transporter small permease [Roseobacter sp. YSTF-M11]|uniref:TRAP transporter small permease protein n=1 Tax=Roseobacter insulae TaxID=2859783 RepID=A0A9X1FZW6_9RHOB|nr:TRAP transporter small permease [Roseobacter insulae]MBW4710692.1 TRAP transporter small permease [Roseobacter insulae]